MAHSSTVLSQMLKLLPRHEFDALAKQHHRGRKLRKISRWSQFVAMSSAQLTGRASLRDLLGNLVAQSSKLYHLGVGLISRSSLARSTSSSLGPYTRRCSSSCWVAVNSVRPGMASASRTSSFHWTHQPLMCAYRCFHGPNSAKPRAGSNCMSVWTTPACCRHLFP